MFEVATARHLLERLEECAESLNFASLLGELAAREGRGAAAPAKDAEANHALVRRYFEMWNTGDPKEADALLASTYLDHAHPSVVGPGAVRSLVRRFRSDNDGARLTAEVLAFDASYVIVRRAIHWSARGTIEPFGVALFRVADGQLVEQWSVSPEGQEVGPPDRSFALRACF